MSGRPKRKASIPAVPPTEPKIPKQHVRKRSFAEELEENGWSLSAGAKPMNLSAADKKAIKAAFSSVTAATIVQKQNLVVVQAGDSLAGALKTLVEGGISSAPIMADEETVKKKKGNITGRNTLGVFEHMDVVKALVTAYAKDPKSVAASVERKVATEEMMKVKFKIEDKVFLVPGDKSLFDTMQDLEQHARVLVVPSGMGPVEKPLFETLGVISQFDIIRFLNELNLKVTGDTIFKLNNNAGLAEDKLGEFVREPVFLEANKTVASAFAHIVAEKVHSLPVLSEAHEFVGHISATDVWWVVKAGKTKMEKVLSMTLQEFVSYKTEPLHFVLPKQATLGDAMKLLIGNRIHQLWVCNEARRIVGIITCADIIRFFARRAPDTW